MPAPDAETPLFDPGAIEKLRAVAGDEAPTFVAEMARLFLDESQEALGRMKEAGAQGDWQQVSRIAHSLKSSAATLGLMRLSAAARALELDTRNEASSAHTRTLLAGVLNEFEQAGPALDHLL